MTQLPVLLMLLATSAFAGELVPIVVAAVDIAAGETVTTEMIAQRKANSSVVTSSVIKPDSAQYIVNQKTRFPLNAGDLLLWTFFEAAPSDVPKRCAAVVRKPESAQAEVARHREVVKRRKR